MARTGLQNADWLDVWFELLVASFTEPRDFWLCEPSDDSTFSNGPVSYSRGLKWVKFQLKEAVDWAQGDTLLSEINAQVLRTIIEKVTWHSFRVTLLNWALHKGKTSEAIALQANWSEPGPLVLK